MSRILILQLHLVVVACGALAIHWASRRLRGGRSYALAALLAVVPSTFLLFTSAPNRKFGDFHDAYWAAGRALAFGDVGALAEHYKQGLWGFVNLPILGYAFAPIGLLPKVPATIVFTLLGLGALALGWWLLSEALSLNSAERSLLLFLFASYGPLYYSVLEANTSHVVVPVLVFVMTRLRAGRDTLAGALMGLLAVVKLPLAVMGLLFLARGRMRAVVAMGLTLLGIGALSVLRFGWDLHVLWYEHCVRPFATDPIGAYNSQSLSAAISRLERGVDSAADWSPHALSMTSKNIALACKLGLAGAIVGAAAPWQRILSGRKLTAAEFELEFLIVLVFACVATPLAWSHYYVWLLIPLAFIAFRSRGGLPRFSVLVPCVLVALMAPPVFYLWPGYGSGLSGLLRRLLTSHLLVGGVCTLLWLVWLRMRAARTPV